MKLNEITEEIPVAINITTANLDTFKDKIFKGVPEHLREFTTPRTEIATISFNDPSPEILDKILNDVNKSITEAFLKSSQIAVKKYIK